MIGPMTDQEWLAERFELTGAAIRNAAVSAAFSAAAEGEQITMPALVRAIAKEYAKLGRLVRPDDFGRYYDALSGPDARALELDD